MGTFEKGQVLHETYRVRRLVATGGMGEVYEARHVRLAQKRFAIKVLHEAVVEDPTACTRFLMEAEIVSGLGHPHIVFVTDFNELDTGQPYMVMEFLEGEELAHRLRHGRRLDPRDVAKLLEQTASALSRVHEQGIVHRDLKPGNIFLVETSSEPIHVKLLDFGISKIKASQMQLTQMKTVLGTPHFMSPEQARGEVHDIDQTTDIFSLAAIAYLCLTGELPFKAAKLADLIDEITSAEPPPPSEVCPELPRALDQVIARAMAKEREGRYQKAEELAVAFREALDGPEQEAGGGEDAPSRQDAVVPHMALPAPVTISKLPGGEEAPAHISGEATTSMPGEEVGPTISEQATVQVPGEAPTVKAETFQSRKTVEQRETEQAAPSPPPEEFKTTNRMPPRTPEAQDARFDSRRTEVLPLDPTMEEAPVVPDAMDRTELDLEPQPEEEEDPGDGDALEEEAPGGGDALEETDTRRTPLNELPTMVEEASEATVPEPEPASPGPPPVATPPPTPTLAPPTPDSASPRRLLPVLGLLALLCLAGGGVVLLMGGEKEETATPTAASPDLSAPHAAPHAAPDAAPPDAEQAPPPDLPPSPDRQAPSPDLAPAPDVAERPRGKRKKRRRKKLKPFREL